MIPGTAGPLKITGCDGMSHNVTHCSAPSPLRVRDSGLIRIRQVNNCQTVNNPQEFFPNLASMVRTVHLGGTASHIEVANIAHGLMRMTFVLSIACSHDNDSHAQSRNSWSPNPISDEQAFRSIKDGIDAAGGAKIYLNSGSLNK